MEENLVGYLLKSLDAETEQQVEASLQTSPQLRTRLELLERALAPLAADAGTPEPRPGLILSTLALVAEHQCLKLPSAPPPRNQTAIANRPLLRRPDVLVAALLLITLGGLGTSALVRVWRDYHNRAACQNNLALVWRTGLQQYCDAHQGDFPRVEEKGPHGVAGIFVPILCENGLLSPDANMMCPAQGHSAAKCRPIRELEELYEKNPGEFLLEARKLASGYAYTLGYRDERGQYHGLRCDSGDALPIMADRPDSRLESLPQLNSANHGGTGQNVLYLGGNVQWHTNRNAGIGGDDIFLNGDNKVLAGKSREDTVLGPSDASPTPKEE